jgi:hypothetical protein
VVNITNSTISGNTAIGPGGNSDSGGGIITNVGTVTLTNTTISGNSGDLGGGFRNINGGTVHVGNTIIALNTSGSGPDINGSFLSDGHNLIGNATAGTGFVNGTKSDQVGVADPKLDPILKNNGGSTNTLALLTGSSAINGGDDALAPKIDQRGYLRAGPSDIGAFEFGGGPLKITSITRANGHIFLQCLGVANQVNNLQVSPDLSLGSFMTISPPPAAADGSGAFQYDDAGAVGLTKRFYRLAFP